jgi:hypothetical protein
MLTLINMIIDALPFFIIIGFYVMIGAQIFTTFFNDKLNEIPFGSLFASCKQMISYLSMSYDYTGAADQEFVYMVFVMIFAFLGNIILLNFLIAILTMSYNEIVEIGNFQ